MPRLSQTPEAPAQTVEFVFSVPLDLLNAMYFTSLVPQAEGVEGWPLALREQMSPDLLAELDALYNYPAGDPGIMGTLGDILFAHPETWASVDALVEYIRAMPDGQGTPESPGLQGLIYETTFRYLDEPLRAPYASLPPRQAVEARLRSLEDRDADAIMPLYDRPQELRSRMIALIERFYKEHYLPDLPRRRPPLERSVAAHKGQPVTDVIEMARRLTGRSKVCLEDVCAGDYKKLIFTPSLDMGPYNSCAVIDGIHGYFYPCEQEFQGASEAAAEETRRLARVYKALGDEQRLRILHLLHEREMYAQEIVERTGLHQSVVSRHLMFMTAVGLLHARRQNNMKFYSLNPAMRETLRLTIELFRGSDVR